MDHARTLAEGQSITRRTTAGPSPRKREHYSGYFLAQNAIAEIESCVRQDQPFLCWAAFSEPHPPFYPPKEIYERFDQSKIALPAQAPPDAPPPHPYIARKQLEWAHLTEVEVRQMLAGYYGMVELVDGYLGEILAALDRLKIRDETAVIWTVDHGDQLWEHRLFVKFNMYDGSTHVPLLIDVPGQAAGVREELVEHVDVFPTICELLGAPCPATVQGRSLSPLLAGGQAGKAWRDAVFSQIGPVQMIRTHDWKLNVYAGEPGELYDLRNDPREFYNRLADPSHRATADALLARLKKWERANQP